MSDFQDITYRREEGFGVITLDRPERLNALSIQTVEELHTVLGRIAGDEGVHVVVLHGAGRAFCAGIDMKQGFGRADTADDKARRRYEVQKAYASLVLRMRDIPQPLIAAVHGYACGGGLSLATACDIRLVAPSAKLNVAFITVGLTGGDMGVSFALPRALGSSLAAELLYTGRFIEADEAVQRGLASRVVAEDELVDTACELARTIAAHNPFGVRLTKEMLNRSLDGAPLRTMVDLENRSQVLASFSGAFDAVVESFSQPAKTGDDDDAHG